MFLKINFIKPELREKLLFLGYNNMPDKLTYYDTYRWLEAVYKIHCNAFVLMNPKNNKFTGYTFEINGEDEEGRLIGLYILDDDSAVKKMPETIDEMFKMAVKKIFDCDDIHHYLIGKLMENSKENGDIKS